MPLTTHRNEPPSFTSKVTDFANMSSKKSTRNQDTSWHHQAVSRATPFILTPCMHMHACADVLLELENYGATDDMISSALRIL